MPNYRIRWKVKGGSTYINSGGSNGNYLPGNAATISSWSGTNSGTTITVTTSSAHGFGIGQGVVISGATPSALNGLVEVLTVPSTTTFTYTVATSPGAASPSGGTVTPTQGVEKTISSISGNGTTVTVTTATAHGFLASAPVRITGVSVAGYNCMTTVASVPSTTTFTYSNTTSTSGATGGTAVSQGVFTIRNANCSSGNSITAGTSYDIEVTYDNGGTPAWSGAAVEATPIATMDALATNYTTTNMTGTNATTSDPNSGTVTRVKFTTPSGATLYGIMVDFLGNWNSWKNCTCTVTYLGLTYSLVTTKGSGGKAYFPVPLGASMVLTADASTKNQSNPLAGSIVVTPYA